MKYTDHFDAFDTSVGKYSAHKVPKWDYNATDILGYLNDLHQHDLDGEDLGGFDAEPAPAD
jgi:hypothetical protein